MTYTHLSLFSGIGGLDLAAEMAGFETVGQCEFADFPTKVLEKHWPNVPRWRDIRTLTGGEFYERTGLQTVDVISGGFPCQPFSVAGKQKGKDDERFLWPEMCRVIRELRPNFVIGENVPGILRIAAADVVEDLEREGYRTVVFDFEAAAIGAFHRRERIFFVAERISGALENADCGGRFEPRILPQQPGRSEPERRSEAVADAQSQRRQGNRPEGQRERAARSAQGTAPGRGIICHATGQDELLRALEYDRNSYADGYRAGVEAAQSKWISVVEQLPPEAGPVLFSISGSMCVAWYCGNGDFETPNGLHRNGYTFDHLYWMPLPEPPKEGE